MVKFNAKYIAVYEAIGDGTRDRGENTFFLALAKDGAYKTTTKYKVLEEYPLSGIEYVDCYHSDRLQSGNVATGAAAGYILGGVGGAVVGGLLNSGAKQSWVCEISYQGQLILFRLNSDRDRNVLIKWADGLGILKQ